MIYDPYWIYDGERIVSYFKRIKKMRGVFFYKLLKIGPFILEVRKKLFKLNIIANAF